jgi:hypothetical protein
MKYIKFLNLAFKKKNVFFLIKLKIKKYLIFFIYHRFISLFLFLISKKKFSIIYYTGYWKNYKYSSLSGAGSNIKKNSIFLKKLSAFIKNKKIRSVTDIPCGDFSWFKKLTLSNINYLGGDIVPDLIKRNKIKYRSKFNKFIILNIKTDRIPDSDFLIIRDLFIHFNDKEIFQSLNNIKKFKFKFIGITSHMNSSNTLSPLLGDNFRPINLTIPPFNLKKPDYIIQDYNSKISKKLNKQMIIWKSNNFYN